MIIFELGCGQGHRFEGWFSSAQDFTRQSEREMVHCPVCDDGHVVIVPSARVRVSRGADSAHDNGGEATHGNSRDPAPVEPPATGESPSHEVPLHLPVELVHKLRETIRNTENVGRRFPEEARKIHYDEVPPRAIRGQASAEEAQSLREEGIEFASLPAFLTSEQH